MIGGERGFRAFRIPLFGDSPFYFETLAKQHNGTAMSSSDGVAVPLPKGRTLFLAHVPGGHLVGEEELRRAFSAAGPVEKALIHETVPRQRRRKGHVQEGGPESRPPPRMRLGFVVFEAASGLGEAQQRAREQNGILFTPAVQNALAKVPKSRKKKTTLKTDDTYPAPPARSINFNDYLVEVEQKYRDPEELRRSTDAYLSSYDMEGDVSRPEGAPTEEEMTADGFTIVKEGHNRAADGTVVMGARRRRGRAADFGAARDEEEESGPRKRKKKPSRVDDFYVFQTRKKKRDEFQTARREVEADRRVVEAMRDAGSFHG
eukprot:Polyplicarium_translucidae@DN5256_c0_g1_i1.p1